MTKIIIVVEVLKLLMKLIIVLIIRITIIRLIWWRRQCRIENSTNFFLDLYSLFQAFFNSNITTDIYITGYCILFIIEMSCIILFTSYNRFE